MWLFFFVEAPDLVQTEWNVLTQDILFIQRGILTFNKHSNFLVRMNAYYLSISNSRTVDQYLVQSILNRAYKRIGNVNIKIVINTFP